jgi:hypothetical protein
MSLIIFTDMSQTVISVYMISAWASESRLVLGQLKTHDNSNEITAGFEKITLLKILEYSGIWP